MSSQVSPVFALTMAKAELSQEQVEELRQAFDMFDRDKGGSISTRELGYTMRAMGMNPTEAEILDLLCEVRMAWLVFSSILSQLSSFSLILTTMAPLSSKSSV